MCLLPDTDIQSSVSLEMYVTLSVTSSVLPMCVRAHVCGCDGGWEVLHNFCHKLRPALFVCMRECVHACMRA